MATINIYKCDICGGEMNKPGNQISIKEHPYRKMKIDFFISAGAGSRDDVCKHCLIDIAKTLDDRPQAG